MLSDVSVAAVSINLFNYMNLQFQSAISNGHVSVVNFQTSWRLALGDKHYDLKEKCTRRSLIALTGRQIELIRLSQKWALSEHAKVTIRLRLYIFTKLNQFCT